MGLDMYLFRKTENGKQQVAYWRKANAIHKYFVDKFQDGNDESCAESKPIMASDLRDLRDVCTKVLKGHNPEELLPTQRGFFFGSTAYDEWYYEDLRTTVEQLDKVLSTAHDAQEFTYLAWW